MTGTASTLADIRTFPQLIKYLRDDLDWPISTTDFDDLTFDYTPEELGIDGHSAAKIQEIKRLRPLSVNQPWGVFFVKFEPKRLPVVALRRILNAVVLKKRTSANHAERAAWEMEDLLFISNYGNGEQRQISFAHFAQDLGQRTMPTLNVLGWDNRDTPLHIDHVAEVLSSKLVWPTNETDIVSWRETWRSAFTLRHREVIATSKVLAIQLAYLARAIRNRINTVLAIETSDGPVTRLMKAFQEALVHDLNADGFADMYAQTISYGLLSARVTDPTIDRADGSPIHLPVTNPFLRDLMETFLTAGGRENRSSATSRLNFDELGVSDVVGLLDAANMEAVVRDFGDRNPQEDPVIHFYELFLKEYDAKKRMQRGVFYTPRSVVTYIVRSVHERLQQEFGLADGLADTTTWGEMTVRHSELAAPPGVSPDDPFVNILDPATGTGTFLVEVMDIVHRTLVDRWKREGAGDKAVRDLWNDYVPKHLLPRLHGYELLMAPYAIAHLKIGLKLHETGYRFDSDQRARIFLTNALEPAHDFSGRFEFAIPALAQEARAVNEVKRRQRFTVVIGNPPYSKVSSNMSPWAQALVKATNVDGVELPSFYEVDGRSLGERKVNLQDDYIKFIRLAQFHGVRSGALVLGMITNRGFLGGPTFRGMRQSLLSTFQVVGVTDLHGDTNVGERPPDGLRNENVFDIQQGVCVSVMVRSPWMEGVEFRLVDVWGSRADKYSWLGHARPVAADPGRDRPTQPYFLFTAENQTDDDDYGAWWSLVDIFPSSASGILTSRDGLVIGLDDEEIWKRIAVFLDPQLSDEQVANRLGLTENYEWRVSEARVQLRSDPSWQSRFENVLYRPFDVRRILYHSAVVWRTREPLMAEMLRPGNVGLVATRQGLDPFSHAFVSRFMIEYKTGSHHRNSQVFPLFVAEPAQQSLFDSVTSRENISARVREDLEEAVLSAAQPSRASGGAISPEQLLRYVYAVLHSPTYRRRYVEQLKTDFPRIPMPGGHALFSDLERLGGQLVGLHLLESPDLQQSTTTFVGPKDPMVGRVSWVNETVLLDAPTRMGGLTSTGFHGVPEAVWNFRIGGYQVCEKWLRDRKGHSLTDADISQYHKVVVAIRETLRVMETIDVIIEERGGWPEAFSRPTSLGNGTARTH